MSRAAGMWGNKRVLGNMIDSDDVGDGRQNNRVRSQSSHLVLLLCRLKGSFGNGYLDGNSSGMLKTKSPVAVAVAEPVL